MSRSTVHPYAKPRVSTGAPPPDAESPAFSDGRHSDSFAAAILAVDDNDVNLRLLSRMLGNAGYTNVQTMSDPTRVGPALRAQDYDLLLLDLHMPEMTGLEVMSEVAHCVHEHQRGVPVIVVTGDATPEAGRRALHYGASDVLRRPFDAGELQLRVRNQLRQRQLSLRLTETVRFHETRLREAAQSEQAIRLDLLCALARIGRSHAEPEDAIAALAECIAVAAGFPPELVAHLPQAAGILALASAMVTGENSRSGEDGPQALALADVMAERGRAFSPALLDALVAVLGPDGSAGG